MRILTLGLLIVFTSLTRASELIIDWSLDLRNPSVYLSPPLRLKCFKTKSIYSIQGIAEPGGNPALFRYKLPDEIFGFCILSLEGGMGPVWPEGNQSIEIKGPDEVVRTRMPETSASFVFTLSKPQKSRCVLQIFKLAKDGQPLPEWAYLTDFSARTTNSRMIRHFTVLYAEAGEYIAYVVETDETERSQYLYVKKFSVTQQNLVRHDQNVTIDELSRASKGHEIQVEFTSDDVFTGVAAIALVNNFVMRSVIVDKDGKIVTP